MITKICGIKTVEHLNCCEKNNVDFFGMIFYNKSSRNISFELAYKLQENSKDLRIKGVGVVVDKKISEVKSLIDNLKLKYIQLHGNENNEYIAEIKKYGTKIIKKISIDSKEDLKKINIYKNADYFLFDYKPKKTELPGGNAKSFNWDILLNLKIERPWFLSGGINVNNISIIKSKINPYGIDLSSGVEKELGIKDNDIINNFMDKLKNA